MIKKFLKDTHLLKFLNSEDKEIWLQASKHREKVSFKGKIIRAQQISHLRLWTSETVELYIVFGEKHCDPRMYYYSAKYSYGKRNFSL